MSFFGRFLTKVKFFFDRSRKSNAFRDSGSGSLCEQKYPPHHLSNPQDYRDSTI